MTTSKSKIAFIDLETYSPVDLGKQGLIRYTQDKDFRIIIGSVIVNNEIKELVGHEKVKAFVKNLVKKGYTLVAHNAAFEYACLKDVSSIDNWECTMLLSSYYSGVLGLGDAAEYWKLGNEKIVTGLKSIKWIIEKKGNLKELQKDVKRWRELVHYCNVDTLLVENLYNTIIKKFGNIPEREKKYYKDTISLSYNKINIDQKGIKRLIKTRDKYNTFIEKFFEKRYGFNPRSHVQVKDWCNKNKFKLEETNKQFLQRNWAKFPKKIQTMLKYKLAFPSNVLKKIDYFNLSYVYPPLIHFGTITGRYASKGVNLLNLPRGGGDPKDLKLTSAEFIKKHKFNTGEQIKSLIRSCIVAPKGQYLAVCDFSQIEFRLLMWVVGHKNIVKDLCNGRDIYLDFAEQLYGSRPAKGSLERNVAKICVLGLGYGLSVNALHAMITAQVPTFEHRLTSKAYATYHKMFPNVRKFHRKLDKYIKTGAESIRLLNGRKLIIRDFDKTLGVGKMRKLIQGRLYPRQVYGSQLCGIFIQANARELIFEKQHELLKEGFNVLFQVYDEIVAQIKHKKELDKIGKIMVKPIDWLDMPLEISKGVDKRYVK